MTTAAPHPSTDTQAQVLQRARQRLAEAATLDLDRRVLSVRCRLGGQTGWWELDQVHRLLELASDVGIEVQPDGSELVVIDGLDVYRFDVT